MDTVNEILVKIAEFEPQDGEWLQLDHYLNELWASGNADKGKEIMLKVFERYPEDDGAGVFWSIVHGLENINNYEEDLIESLQRQPSEMGVLMLKRLQNSGQQTVAGQDIDLIYRIVYEHPCAPESVKTMAMTYKKVV